MLVLASATLANYSNDIAKAQQSEALIQLASYRQALTANYMETMKWSPEKSYNDSDHLFGSNTFIKEINFDGKGGLHATFSDQVIKELQGKTLSFVASTNPPNFTRVIWNCGNSDQLPGFVPLSKNKTNIPVNMLIKQCKSSSARVKESTANQENKT